MSEEIPVSITSTTTSYNPPATSIAYSVRNARPAAVWLVNDGWFIWRQRGTDLEISTARGRMTRGSHPFGYFVPDVLELPSGQTLARSIDLQWPLRLDTLWNDVAD